MSFNDPFSYTSQHVSSVDRAATDISSDMASNSIKLLTGNSHPELAKRVAHRYVRHVDALEGLLSRDSAWPEQSLAFSHPGTSLE